jgi:hypothetical protein
MGLGYNPGQQSSATAFRRHTLAVVGSSQGPVPGRTYGQVSSSGLKPSQARQRNCRCAGVRGSKHAMGARHTWMAMRPRVLPAAVSSRNSPAGTPSSSSMATIVAGLTRNWEAARGIGCGVPGVAHSPSGTQAGKQWNGIPSAPILLGIMPWHCNLDSRLSASPKRALVSYSPPGKRTGRHAVMPPQTQDTASQ